jgi:hypothetical protein
MCWLAWSNEIGIFITNAKLGMHLSTFREESWAGQKHTSLSDQLKKLPNHLDQLSANG